MTLRVAMYRLYRLRRLILVSAVPTLLAVLVVAAFKGPSALALLPIALGVPLAHLLRYPTAWTETIIVSLVTMAVLLLAGTIGAEVGLPGLALRIAGLALFGVVLFFVLTSRLSEALVAGPTVEHTSRARRWSSLPTDQLKAAITIYPGREDARVTCSAADEDGAFAVTIRQPMESLCGEEGETLDIEMFAQVLTSTEDVHEVMCVEASTAQEDLEAMFEEAGAELEDELRDAIEAYQAEAEDTPPAVCVSRHSFMPAKRGGTYVDVAETGAALTRGMRFGFWAQDYFADHLTDEVDRAEGRPPRSNRSTTQSQLIVDIAKLLMGRQTPVHPAE